MDVDSSAARRSHESSLIQPFSDTLAEHGLDLARGRTTTLQVNVGFLCNNVCKHCHLEAGPGRTQIMGPETVDQVIEFAQKGRFQVIDITGGAPELNPHLIRMIELFSNLAPRLMLRSNLTAPEQYDSDLLMNVVSRHHVVIAASFPSLNADQFEAQRGFGTWEKSLAALRRLNSIGYGMPDSGLELNLVSNPAGAFLPASQKQLEDKFRKDMQRRFGIVFSHLYIFANVPLGRFRRWLIESGNYEKYMTRLVSLFNECTLDGLMCRTLISVSWDGYLYDCDFNQAEDIPAGWTRTHVSEMTGPPLSGTPVAVSDHCYSCTAGSGFT